MRAEGKGRTKEGNEIDFDGLEGFATFDEWTG